MKYYAVEAIQISPNRQRKFFDPDAIFSLAASIETKGLLHAVVVRQGEDGITLVAGERRLKAISTFSTIDTRYRYDGAVVPAGHIPCIDVSELDALALEEAELEENVCRMDLTWQERAEAELRLHNLRSKQAASRNETQTIWQTAIEVAPTGNASAVRQEIIVARHLHDPEIAKASTPKEAFKLLQKREALEQHELKAATVGANFTQTSQILLNTDALVWLDKCPSEQFDVILTDPPYGIDADEFGDSSGRLASYDHRYSDSTENFMRIMVNFRANLFRVAKPQAHMYLFCDLDKYPYLVSLFKESGWKVHRTPIIWHKPKSHRVPWPDQGPRRHYEIILYAVKGNKPTKFIRPDMISADVEERLGHPAQKPIALLEELIQRSADPGDKILDPCMGSGSTIIAAFNKKCFATGIEIDPAHYGLAVKRLEETNA